MTSAVHSAKYVLHCETGTAYARVRKSLSAKGSGEPIATRAKSLPGNLGTLSFRTAQRRETLLRAWFRLAMTELADGFRGFPGSPNQPRRAIFRKLSFEIAKVGDGLFRLGFEMIDMLLARFEQRFQIALVHLEFTAFAAFFCHKSSDQRQSSRSFNFGLLIRLDPNQLTPFLPPHVDVLRRRGLALTPSAIPPRASGCEIASRDHVTAFGNRLWRVPQHRKRLGIQIADWLRDEAKVRVAVFSEEESRPRIRAKLKSARGEVITVRI